MYILGKGKWTKVTIAMVLSAFLLFSQIAMAMPRTMQEANVPFKGKLILPVVIKKLIQLVQQLPRLEGRQQQPQIPLLFLHVF